MASLAPPWPHPRTRRPAPLARYRQKRDFARTPEPDQAPSGSEAGEEGPGRADLRHPEALGEPPALRLPPRARRRAAQLGGAQGPSFDPSKMQMAIHVEDHPLAYGGFEGTIPPKQYGAGTVIVWDRGTWEPVGDPREGMAKASCCSACTARSSRACGSWCASPSPATSRTRGCCSRRRTSGRGRWPSTT